MTIVDSPVFEVTRGVDTHLETHVAAALNPIGGLLGVAEFDTTQAGLGTLFVWLNGFGPISKVGVEGTDPTSMSSLCPTQIRRDVTTSPATSISVASRATSETRTTRFRPATMSVVTGAWSSTASPST